MIEKRRLGERFHNLLQEIERDLSEENIPEAKVPWWNKDNAIKNPPVSSFKSGDIIQVWSNAPKEQRHKAEIIKVYDLSSTSICIEFFDINGESLSLGSYWTLIGSLQGSLNLANHYIVIGNESEELSHRPGPDDGKPQHVPVYGEQVCMECDNAFQSGDMLIYCLGKDPGDWYLQHYICPERRGNSETFKYENLSIVAGRRRNEFIKRMLCAGTKNTLRRLSSRERKRRNRHKQSIRFGNTDAILEEGGQK